MLQALSQQRGLKPDGALIHANRLPKWLCTPVAGLDALLCCMLDIYHASSVHFSLELQPHVPCCPGTDLHQTICYCCIAQAVEPLQSWQTLLLLASSFKVMP